MLYVWRLLRLGLSSACLRELWSKSWQNVNKCYILRNTFMIG